MRIVPIFKNWFLPGEVSDNECIWIISVISIYLLIATIGIIAGIYWISFFPIIFVLLYFLLQDLRIFFFAIVFLVPFSFELAIPGMGSGLQFPTEPMIILLITIWFLNRIYFGTTNNTESESTNSTDKWLKLFLIVIGVSVLTSSHFIISIKMLANTLWYLIACVYFVRKEFVEEDDVASILKIMFLSSFITLCYALVRLGTAGFANTASNWAPQPLFSEHGSYSAYLSIILGIAISISFGAGKYKKLRMAALILTPLLLISIIFSFARAAWIGVVVLLFFLLVVKSKEILNFKTFIMLIILSGLITVGIISVGIQASLQKDIQSISDVESNVSNLERFNRWMAAINMIRAHPLLGVGYGAYPDEYIYYQDRRFNTTVSNFLGSTHNDYLQYFSEAGIFALLFWLLFIFSLFKMGLKLYYKIPDEFFRNVTLGCLGGVLTYLVHAMFNGFLQFDKVALPFWTSVAVIFISKRKYAKQ